MAERERYSENEFHMLLRASFRAAIRLLRRDRKLFVFLSTNVYELCSENNGNFRFLKNIFIYSSLSPSK